MCDTVPGAGGLGSLSADGPLFRLREERLLLELRAAGAGGQQLQTINIRSFS